MNCKKNFAKISIFSVILVLLGALFCYSSKALNLPEPTKEFYINDFAGVLSEETKQYILNQSNALNEKTSAQIAVATVNSLEDASIEEYALALFRKWGVGSKEKNNGLLILLAPNERKIRVEVGYGLEGKINDSKAGRFIKEYAVPHLKNNDWDNGIHDLYSVILTEIYGEYNMEVPEEVKEVSGKIYDQNTMDDMVTIFISFAVIITSAVISFFVRRNPKWRRRHSNYNGPDDFHGGFGGFYGGGSSGGGFGGFSGGGGSSGGGGASSSF